jgi:hypothetical protein
MLEVKATDSRPALGPVTPWPPLGVSFEVEDWYSSVLMDDHGVIGKRSCWNDFVRTTHTVKPFL